MRAIKLSYFTSAAVLLLVGLLAACSRPASVPPIVDATDNAPLIVIERVQVSEGSGIYITGRSTLTDGECVKTELLAGGNSLDWWPRDVCVEVAGGRWEILVALGQNGAPQNLEPDVDYEIRAWWAAQPEIANTRFPFDLRGPPAAP